METGTRKPSEMEDRATDCVSLIRDDTRKQSDLTFLIEKFSFLFATGSGSEGQSSTDLRGGSEGRDAERLRRRDLFFIKITYGRENNY